MNDKPGLLDHEILEQLKQARRVTWLSPLRDQRYAEYRDGDFLELLGRADLIPRLAKFWPARGPQWDAIATTDNDDVLLVEAKAHIAELCSPPTAASPKSRKQIERALKETIHTCKAQPRAAWTDVFYQLANRLAHLKFLRDAKVRAWLVLVNFLGDADMKGPTNRAEWEAAYAVALYVLGLEKRNPLAKYIIHVYPDVRGLAQPPEQVRATPSWTAVDNRKKCDATAPWGARRTRQVLIASHALEMARLLPISLCLNGVTEKQDCAFGWRCGPGGRGGTPESCKRVDVVCAALRHSILWSGVVSPIR